jgi:hypothetical protein
MASLEILMLGTFKKLTKKSREAYRILIDPSQRPAFSKPWSTG